MWRDGNFYTLTIICIGAATLESHVKTPQKTKIRINIWSSHPSHVYKFTGNEIFILGSSMSRLIMTLFIKTKTWSQARFLSADEWVKAVWCAVHSEMLPNNKGPNPLVCREMDGTHRHYSKWNRPATERQISCFLSNSESIISLPESSVDVAREEHYGSHEDGRRMDG